MSKRPLPPNSRSPLSSPHLNAQAPRGHSANFSFGCASLSFPNYQQVQTGRSTTSQTLEDAQHATAARWFCQGQANNLLELPVPASSTGGPNNATASFDLGLVQSLT